jgi:fibronectin-binding autotransporter adhesin
MCLHWLCAFGASLAHFRSAVTWSRPIACGLIVGMATLLARPVALRAATDTWSGLATPDANWMTAGNWDTLPSPNDILAFDGTTGLTNNNNFTAGTQFNGITFNSTAGLFVLGGNSVLLGGDINDKSTTNAETINLGLLLNGGTSNVKVAAGGTLNLGAITFGSTSGSTSVSTLNVNNTVSAASLFVQTNTTSANTISIASGQTFNISGSFGIGTAPTGSADTNAVLNVSGAGTLNITSTTNTSFNVGVGAGTNTPSGRPVATVDMSGLANFVFSTGTGSFGVGNLVTRSSSTLKLANTSNSITAATVGVGDSNQPGGNNNGLGSTLDLGAGTNTINANTINVGFTKTSGNVQFLTTTGSVAIAGEAGGASTANITVGRASSSTDTNTASQFLLAGHTANVQAGTVQVGVLAGATGGTPAGNMTFDTGTFTVNSLQLGVDSSGTAPNGVSGTFTLGGASPNTTATGMLNVTGASPAFFLGNVTNANTGTKTDKATFIINGGTANISTNIQTAKAAAATGTTVTSTLTVAGGTLNMNGNSIGTAAAPITTVNLPAAGQTATLSNLGGTGINGAGITMNGAGTLILTGSNPYTSGTSVSTTVSSGTLRNNGTITGGDTNVSFGGVAAGTGTYGNVNVNGGTFTAGSLTSTGTVNAGNLTVNSGVTEIKFGGSNADLINLTGTTGLTNSQIMIGQLSAVTPGQYLVLTSSGPLSNITAGLLTTNGRTSYTIDSAAFTANPNQIKIDVGGAPASLKWTGADATNPTNWDNSQTAANWQRTDGGTSDPTHFYDADNVTFDGTNSGASISIGGTVTPGSIAVTAGTYTIGGGQIAGSGTVTVSGTGNLTLNGVNTMTGPVNVNGGTLHVATSSAAGNGPITIGGGTVSLDTSFALNNTNTITLNTGSLNLNDVTGTALGTGLVTINGGTLDNTSAAAVTQANNPPLSIGGSFTFTGAADGSHDLNMGTGSVALTASPIITVSAGTLTIDGTISGAGRSLTKDGAGKLILDNSVLAANNADNSYSGGATVNAGTLQVSRKTSGRTPLGSGNTTVNAGGTLVGGNLDAFGFTSGVSPPTIFINGGTVTDLASSSFRITLQDVNFTGGTLTSDPTNIGGNDSGGIAASNYSLSVGTIETNATTSTAVISAGIVALQHGVVTFTVAPGAVTGGPTPGVDLLVSSSLIEWHPNATTTTIGSINKTGTGVMLLTGTSTYTGTTTVTGGTLRLASSTVNNNIANSSTIVVNSGGTLDVFGVTTAGGFMLASPQTLTNKGTVTGSVDLPTGTIATGTGTYGPIVLDGGTFTAGSATTIGTVGASTLTVNSGALKLKFSGASADLVNLSGATNLTNAGISIGQLSLPTPGSYLVLTSGSNLSGITPGQLPTSTGRITYTVDGPALMANPNHLTIDVAGTPATLKWTGADATNPSLWDNMQTAANWQRTDGGTNDPTHFYDLDNTLFDGTNTGPSNITISGTVMPGSINVSAGTYTFGGTGAIADSGGLSIGTGASLTIATDNPAYAGAVNVSSGGTLRIMDPSVTSGGAGVGSGTINVDGTLFNNRSDTVTWVGVLSGAGTIHQAGTGTLILAGNNTFSGNFSLESGILQAGSAGAFNTTTPPTVSFPANVPANTTLRLNGFGVTVGGLNTDPVNPGSAFVDNNSATAATLTVKSPATNTFAGVLQDGSTGKLSLTMSGGGTLLLSGTNNFSGLTLINGGSTIQTAVAANLVGLAGQVQFNVGSLHITGDPNNPSTVIVAANTSNKFTTSGNSGATGTFNIDSGVTFQVGASATQTSAVLQTAGSGAAGNAFMKTGGGTMIIYGQNNQQDTDFQLKQGTIDLRSARGLGGQDTSAVRLDMSDGTTLILDADPGFNNVTVPPPAGLTGTDFLTALRAVGTNASINVTVDQLTAGSANSQAIGALQASSSFTMNVTSGPNMTSGTAGLFLDQNPAQTGGGFNGAVTLSGDGTFNVVNNTATGVAMQMTINGGVTGGFGLIKNGNGTLTLDSASTYTGTTTVNNGTLRTATVAGTIGTGPLAINAAAGVTSTVSLANSQSVQSLTAATDPAGLAVVDVASGSTLSVTGASSIQGNLSKTSAGTLVVGGTSSLATGSAMQVNGGTLRVNVSGSSSVGAGVTVAVATSGTLELDGQTSALTDATTPINRARIINSGSLVVGNSTVAPATAQQVGGIDGVGTTSVADNGQLTADHIVQSALVIGSTGSSPSLVTIVASDANGNPQTSAGGLALAGPLTPSAPFGSATASGSSLLVASGLASDGGSSMGGGAMGASLGGSASVPEPSTLLLAIFAASWAALLRRRRDR